jgi:D-amino-acid dehydrogenase
VSRRITVLGAGIVGVATASWLRRDGHEVTLVDRGAPGEFCSAGNAGILSPGSVVPVGTPGILARVPQYLTDPAAPLSIHWSHLPRALPWLMRFVAASRRGRVEQISRALRPLVGSVFESYRPLVQDAGCADLIHRTGYIGVYESEAAFRADAYPLRLRRERGVIVEDMTAGELRAHDPQLAPIYARGVRLPEQGHVSNPLWLAQRLFRHYAAHGGSFVQREVRGFEVGAGRVRALHTDAGPLPVETLVLCAGVHSGALAARLGAQVPLESQRGYHVHFPNPGIEPPTPVMSGEYKFFTTPMADGLRIAGTVEIAGIDAPPTQARIDALVAHAKRMYPALDTSGMTTWMGHRPCTPDSLPVIGRAPGVANAWFAFGHGHLGLCAAAPTGRLIAELIAGRPPFLDPQPYRPERF